MDNSEVKNIFRRVFHFYDKHLGDEDDMISLEELNEAYEKILMAIEQKSKYRKEAKRWKNKALKEKHCKDCISREEAIKQIQRYGVGCFDADDFSVETATRFVISKLNELDSVESDEKYKEFVKWVAEEIFDEDFDDYFDNYYFFQTACRKLEKFGIVKLIDGNWVLVESVVEE